MMWSDVKSRVCRTKRTGGNAPCRCAQCCQRRRSNGFQSARPSAPHLEMAVATQQWGQLQQKRNEQTHPLGQALGQLMLRFVWETCVRFLSLCVYVCVTDFLPQTRCWSHIGSHKTLQAAHRLTYTVSAHQTKHRRFKSRDSTVPTNTEAAKKDTTRERAQVKAAGSPDPISKTFASSIIMTVPSPASSLGCLLNTDLEQEQQMLVVTRHQANVCANSHCTQRASPSTRPSKQPTHS